MMFARVGSSIGFGSIDLIGTKSRFISYLPIINLIFLFKKHEQIDCQLKALGTEKCFSILQTFSEREKENKELRDKVSNCNVFLSRANQQKIYETIEDEEVFNKKVEAKKNFKSELFNIFKRK